MKKTGSTGGESMTRAEMANGDARRESKRIASQLAELEGQIEAGNYRSNADRVRILKEIEHLRTYRNNSSGKKIKK